MNISHNENDKKVQVCSRVQILPFSPQVNCDKKG